MTTDMKKPHAEIRKLPVDFVRIPSVPRKTESPKYWYDRLQVKPDEELASREQIRRLNNAAFQTIHCHMHDIFNYEPNYYDQKLEQHRITENRELVFNQLKLGTDNSQWKKDIQSNINGSRCLNGKDGFCWGIGKKALQFASFHRPTCPKQS